jgi:DNA-directed RNA polymerase specialized sigma24 family protein
VELAADDQAILLRLARGFSPAEVAQELALSLDEVQLRLGAMLRQLTEQRRERGAQ